MPPIWEMIAEREAAANAAAGTLREQIGTLTAELAQAETELAELAINPQDPDEPDRTGRSGGSR